MQRQVTSKSRGICRYYNTSRGCFAGDDCKFKHGEHEKLTPYDKSKACRYFTAGASSRDVSYILLILLLQATVRGEKIVGSDTLPPQVLLPILPTP
jgi:hypothetical protein